MWIHSILKEVVSNYHKETVIAQMISQIPTQLCYHHCILKGFDTHSNVEVTLKNLFGEINDAFVAYSEEMKSMSLWNNVTLIQTSDFARTLSPNGGDGTDHAWGGNYMMMGKLECFG